LFKVEFSIHRKLAMICAQWRAGDLPSAVGPLAKAGVNGYRNMNEAAARAAWQGMTF
jgi:hypothetical protein